MFARYPDQILFYKRYIDNIIGLWLVHPDRDTDRDSWSHYKEFMNSYHGLPWIFQEQSNQIDFLDMTISIKDGQLETTLFEKALNLHLYIPPSSAHPPVILTGLITGNRDILIPQFNKALVTAKNYSGPDPTKQASTLDNSIIFFHKQYHPQDVPSSDIQDSWQVELETPRYHPRLSQVYNCAGQLIPLTRMIVAYSRPPNIGKNLLTYWKLTPAHSRPVSSFLLEML
eukprot:scaffold29456_cov59-Attheya_sp.AAC.3